MKNFNRIAVLLFLFLGLTNFAQQGGPRPTNKIKVTGKIVDKKNNQPLEFATITLKNQKNPKAISGGITNNKGEYEADVIPGIYDITIEFISFKSVEIKGKNITEKTSIGTTGLEEDASQLNEVVVRAEKSSVEIKLDKKVYNVGQDMMVRGGTVSDVLDNVPSVSVDTEGNVSLRGSDNVRILIDGRPSYAVNIAEALRQLPADAIDKVEVITNPSARYDAEGGSGIINIVLKKGKNHGFNGTLIASTGIPETYGLTANVNYKTEKFNYFTTAGYNHRTNEGGGKTNSEYFNKDGSIKNYLYEDRDTERTRDGFNGRAGVEWTVAPNTYWTNAINYEKNTGDNTDLIKYDGYDAFHNFTESTYRSNTGDNGNENFSYTSNLIKNFNDKGHKLTVDGSLSRDIDDSQSIITGSNNYNNTLNNQVQKQAQIQADYVLPLGEGSQFEAGYKGSFGDLNNIYSVKDENGDPISNLSNTLEYKENINALYTQYGFKVNKFSYLFGLRWEDTNIHVNLLDEPKNFNTKKYNNLFPSAFISYEISDQSNLTTSYSKRLTRPRGRFMNPAVNYSSNVNIFQGNPDLNPSLTDKFDFGYIKRWEKVTFNASAYFENTKDVFSFVRSPNGDVVTPDGEVVTPPSGVQVDGIPVIKSQPINLGKEQKFGFEFTLNYNPFKIWRINSNFNLYNVKTTGEHSYTDTTGKLVVQDLNNQANNWFARVNSKLTLPYKIDWQLNATYNGAQKTAQGKSLDQFSMNTAFSKDIMKDKATIAFNISDIFNTRIMRSYTYFTDEVTNLPTQTSYGEMQYRKRQFNLSFTYRFNKAKGEKEKNQPKNEGGGDGGGDFPG